MFLASFNGETAAVTDHQAALICENAIAPIMKREPGTILALRPDWVSVRLDFMGDSNIDAIHRQVGIFLGGNV